MRARLLAATVAALLLPAAPAAAGDPIMPLSQVRSGMQCTGYSVVRGTEISRFDVQIEDVIDGDASGEGPRLLIRVSGPAVDSHGRRPRASPARRSTAPTSRAPQRNAGAISESLGEYGGEVVLATPIESILGTPPDAPSARGERSASSAPAALPGAHGPRAAARDAADGDGRQHDAGPRAERAGTRVGRPCSPPPPGRSAASRRSRCAPAPRSASPTRRGTSRSARSGPSPTPTRTACGRSATRSRTPARGACSSRTPTSTA